MVSSTATSAGVVVGEVLLAGGAYAVVISETTGSAQGEFSEQESVQSVPVTEPLWEGEVDGLETSRKRPSFPRELEQTATLTQAHLL